MNLQTFTFHQQAPIRAALRDGDPWFVAKDVCLALGISWSGVTLSNISEANRGVMNFITPGGSQALTIISESALYKLAFRSYKPEAEAFTDWVASEVLPAIRKTGRYAPADLSRRDILRMALEAEEALAAATEALAQAAPKVVAFNLFLDAGNTQSVEQVAKAIGTGRNKLFAFLRSRAILKRDNLPYQYYIDRGYFTVIEVPVTHRSGSIHNHTQTRVTAKGAEYIGTLWASQNAVVYQQPSQQLPQQQEVANA